MTLDSRAVQYFLEVCRAGSISQAARVLNLSQPSVSVAVSRLERVLGSQLFERHRSGIRLTSAGQALRRRAEAMENLLQGAGREIHLLRADISGPLVIGGTPGALATVIPRTVGSLRKRFPRVELRILERPDSDLRTLLQSQTIDLAVVTLGMDATPDEFCELQVLQDPFALIVGRANGHRPDKVSLWDLEDAGWVLPDAVGGFRRHVDALFVSSNTPVPRNVIRCDSLLTTKAIVRDTDYVTILPREVVGTELAIGELRALQIEGADFERKVGFLWLREHPLDALATAFLEHARSWR